MCFKKLFEPKAKKETAPKKETLIKFVSGVGKGHRYPPMPPEADLPDEEFQLPTLARGNFSMTEELRRRQMEEQLKRRYGISTEKEGSVV